MKINQNIKLEKINFHLVLSILAVLGSGILLFLAIQSYRADEVSASKPTPVSSSVINQNKDSAIDTSENAKQKIVTHIATPKAVKGVYLSGYAAGTKSFKNRIIDLIDKTELNSVVLDVKDSTGRINFKPNDPDLIALGSGTKRIADIDSLVAELHNKNIYIIGRVAVFQDPYLANLHPEWALKNSATGKVWHDNKGLAWLDPASPKVHNYILKVAIEAYGRGFDEINFDYIRYPSDGPLSQIVRQDNAHTLPQVINTFFAFLDNSLHPHNIPISADLFGLTTIATDDMGIGQVWENAAEHFDYLSPMVYPSHYASGFQGYKTPGDHPYEVVNASLASGQKRLLELQKVETQKTDTTSGTPEQINSKKMNGAVRAQIRPWLQDFSLKVTYTPAMVRQQIQATYDNNISSWLLWNAANRYQEKALLSAMQKSGIIER